MSPASSSRVQLHHRSQRVPHLRRRATRPQATPAVIADFTEVSVGGSVCVALGRERYVNPMFRPRLRVKTATDRGRMDIEVSSDNTIKMNASMIKRVGAEIAEGLDRFQDRLTRVEIHLSGDHAATTGTAHKRCVLEARPVGQQPVAVTATAETISRASADAVRKLRTLLDRKFSRLDDHNDAGTIRHN